ncbi:hypothetical protein [Nonomuraea sp. SYSU D8015]|uniref:hypothetical protein n=1 Tax=Nonomuraea sp. SYSU D8015 TaxID=2593644 RepID=UPI00166025AF|nr:hypothetical protein [Nonomuraea sp. SYSU D8015]
MQTQAGDGLVERIRTHSADDDVVGPAANDLLSELYAGYPVENLRTLLRSGDDAAVKTGTWLLSELGERAAPLLDEVPALLAHPLPRVRYFAIEIVLLSADSAHGPVIAQVMNLSRDPERAVRWKVLEFLAEAADDQLAAGAAALEPGEVKELAEWLIRLDGEEEPDPRDVLARLEGPDPVARLFAAAAAAHLSDEDDTNLLQHAATAEDEEISSFARQRLEELAE